MKKIILKLGGSLLVISLCWTGIQPAKAIYQTANSNASVAVGQTALNYGYANQGATVQSNTLYSPQDVYVYGSKMFVADYNNNRVLIYNSLPVSHNAAADIVIGQPNLSDNTVRAAAANTLYHPRAVCYDGTKLYIADMGYNRVLIYNSLPTENNASANVVVGQSNMTNSTQNEGVIGGGAAANRLYEPYDVWCDGTRLIISDNSNNRVLIYNTVPASNNASANVVVGQQNMTDRESNQNDVVAAANYLSHPTGLLMVGSKLFVSDYGNNRVLIYNSLPAANNANADVVIGHSSMTSNTLVFPPTASSLLNPMGIHSDGTRLAMDDASNHRVVIFNAIPTANGATPSIVLGQPDFTSNNPNQGPDWNTYGATAANTLGGPASVFFAGNQLYVADAGNHRIAVFQLAPSLVEVTAIGVSTDSTPGYAFYSTEPGTATLGGGCATANTSVSTGTNTITLGELADGSYAGCTLSITNALGFQSATLAMSPFTIDAVTISAPGVSGTGDTLALNYSKKKSARKKVSLTFQGISMTRYKKANARVYVGSRRMKVISVKKNGANTQVSFWLKYGRMARGSYNLTFSYKNKVSNRWTWQSVVKNSLISIN